MPCMPTACRYHRVLPSQPTREHASKRVSRLHRARLRAPGIIALLAALIAAPAGAHKKASEGPTVLAPGYAALEYAAPVAGTYALPALGPAANGRYLDSQAAAGELHDLFRDRVTVISFIYTQCDDVNGCPLATFVMGQMARRLQADPQIRKRLRLVSFSFDIDKDTPAALERYAQSFRPQGASWDFVTAPDRASLTRTLAAYQQSVQQSEGHAFAHILRVFLVDSDLRIRNIYSTAFLHADTLAADIKTVLLEQGDIESGGGHTGLSTKADQSSTPAADPHLGLPPPQAMNGPVPTAAQAALGEQLFFDRRLSLNRTISCAMCHIPSQGFAVNSLATAVGIEGRTVKRNAPTLLNVAFLNMLFHDGRENRLEQQVWGPLLAHNEMANPSIGYVLDNLKRWPEYRGRFNEAFGAEPSMETVGRALASYERTLIAGGSAFDRFYYAKDPSALSDAAKRGFAIFRGKGGCAACHTFNDEYALFTDQALHNTGLGFLASMTPDDGRRSMEVAPGTSLEYELTAVADSSETPPNDLGRYEITEDPDDRWKFRTPSLRNASLTLPYMHNGSLSTLEDVIAFYNDGGIPNDLLDPLIRPLGLTNAERADLASFLRSLTSESFDALVERAQQVEIGNPKFDQ